MSKPRYPWELDLDCLVGNDWTAIPDTRSPEMTDENRRFTLQYLKNMTGQDFGFDVEQWRKWFETHVREYLSAMEGNQVSEENLELFLRVFPELRTGCDEPAK